MSSTPNLEAEPALALRADRELTGLPMQSNQLPRPAPVRADPEGLSVTTLTMAGVAAVFGVGWILQRRSRLAAQHAEASPAIDEPTMPNEETGSVPGTPALRASSAAIADGSSEPSGPRASETAGAPLLAPEPLPEVEVTFAPVAPGAPGLPPDSTLPQELALAMGRELGVTASLPPAREEIEPGVQPRRPITRSVGVRTFLIKFLLLARTVAGGSAIMAAIAIVVFWAIEAIDSSTRETQLNLVLLGLVLAAGVGAWCCGWFANQLHRSLYNRNHPKFDD